MISLLLYNMMIEFHEQASQEDQVEAVTLFMI